MIISIYLLLYLFYEKFVYLKSDVNVWPQYSRWKLNKFIIFKVIRITLLSVINRGLNKRELFYNLNDILIIFLSFLSFNLVIIDSQIDVYDLVVLILAIKTLVVIKEIKIKDFSALKLIHQIVRNLGMLILMLTTVVYFPLKNAIITNLYSIVYLVLGISIIYKNFRIIELCRGKRAISLLFAELATLSIVIEIYYQNNLDFLGISSSIIILIFPFIYIRLGNSFKKIMHKNTLYVPTLKSLEALILISIIGRMIIWKF